MHVQAMQLHSKQRSNTAVKFSFILVYLGTYTIKPLKLHCVRLERQKKFFLVWTSRSVNKSILTLVNFKSFKTLVN